MMSIFSSCFFALFLRVIPMTKLGVFESFVGLEA